MILFRTQAIDGQGFRALLPSDRMQIELMLTSVRFSIPLYTIAICTYRVKKVIRGGRAGNKVIIIEGSCFSHLR